MGFTETLYQLANLREDRKLSSVMIRGTLAVKAWCDR
jgi:hypothetical protein